MRRKVRAQAESHAPQKLRKQSRNLLKLVGSGVITGAADDDPSAIGTYASAGARFGLAFLWVAPVLLPMMYAVVYISSKLGQVYGKGLFDSIRDRFPPWVLYPILVAGVAGNVIEAAADLGGIAAALNLQIPLPIPAIVAIVAAIVFALQWWGSYALLRRVFKWLALALFAYVVAAIMAKPDLRQVWAGTLTPRLGAGWRTPCDAGGLHRHLPFRLYLHLAVQPGSGGEDRPGPPTMVAAPRRHPH